MTTAFNFGLLGRFGNKMYDTLLYKEHLVHTTPKLVEFKEIETDTGKKVKPYEDVRGYVFVKDNKRYLLPHVNKNGEDNLGKLPVRVTDTMTLDTKGNDVVERINHFKSFVIRPVMVYTFQDIINLDGMIHSAQDEYRLWKIVCWCARLGRIAVRVSTNPGFGKTSYLKMINMIYDKSYVIKPRSLPGIAKGISPDGVMGVDEIGDIKSEIRPDLFNALSQLGEFSPTLTLGTAGSMAHKTQAIYNVWNLSCVVLYNRVEDYKKKDDFFDYMFSNTRALNHRYLPLRPKDGVLDIKQFEDSKDMELTVEIETMFRNMMKSLEYYSINRTRHVDDKVVKAQVNGYPGILDRHRISFSEIVKFVYLYSQDKDGKVNMDMFRYYSDMLHSWYVNYQDAIGTAEAEQVEVKVAEEKIV